jgi:enamine deaminase RidA (YjgF/YER057c/UK114 family)
MIKRIANPFTANFSDVIVIPPNGYPTSYIAGQVGHPAEGPVKVTAATLEEEARLCFGNIRLALEKVGASMERCCSHRCISDEFGRLSGLRLGFGVARQCAFGD